MIWIKILLPDTTQGLLAYQQRFPFFFVEQFESQKQSLSQPRDKALNFRGELVILSLSLAKLLTKHTLIHNPCHLAMLGTKLFPTGRRAVYSFLYPLMQLKFGKLKLS